jgi:cytochrome P450 / NADPH-cytochrome P450 reductase
MNFLWYNLLNHPDALQKCYAEVDEVVGTAPLELSHIPKLKYIQAALREALRYLGPIPSFSRHCKQATTLAGKYKIEPGQTILCNLNGLHHDPAVWGPDANVFRPERFLNGGWEALPQNAWRPFGTGARSCIGRGLAEQEIIITMAMIMQSFVVEQGDPDYVLSKFSTMRELLFIVNTRNRRSDM